jgi:hypothetical protein
MGLSRLRFECVVENTGRESKAARGGTGWGGAERRGAERADGLSSASVAGLFGKGVLSEKDRIWGGQYFRKKIDAISMRLQF